MDTPLVYLTGTPGTGKSTLGQYLVEQVLPDAELVEINPLLHKNGLAESYDQPRDSWVYDIGRAAKVVEEVLAARKSPTVLAGAPLPLVKTRFSVVGVLTCSLPQLLRRRLEARGYHQAKVEENLQAELLGEVLGNVLDWLAPKSPVCELDSCTSTLEALAEDLATYL